MPLCHLVLICVGDRQHALRSQQRGRAGRTIIYEALREMLSDVRNHCDEGIIDVEQAHFVGSLQTRALQRSPPGSKARLLLLQEGDPGLCSGRLGSRIHLAISSHTR